MTSQRAVEWAAPGIAPPGRRSRAVGMGTRVQMPFIVITSFRRTPGIWKQVLTVSC